MAIYAHLLIPLLRLQRRSHGFRNNAMVGLTINRNTLMEGYKQATPMIPAKFYWETCPLKLFRQQISISHPEVSERSERCRFSCSLNWKIQSSPCNRTTKTANPQTFYIFIVCSIKLGTATGGSIRILTSHLFLLSSLSPPPYRWV